MEYLPVASVHVRNPGVAELRVAFVVLALVVLVLVVLPLVVLVLGLGDFRRVVVVVLRGFSPVLPPTPKLGRGPLESPVGTRRVLDPCDVGRPTEFRIPAGARPPVAPIEDRTGPNREGRPCEVGD